MSKKRTPSPFRHVGGEVPAELLADLDRVAESLGLLKKRLLAAAVASFIQAGADEQLRLYQDVYRRYYAPSAAGGPEDLARDAQAALHGAASAHKAKARKSAAEKTA
ncbi:MAG: hypothetical protein NT031_09715 [Planctomycetota bacterium]|nr:hypothetical protein [Planctomycetota bacterium]